MNPRDLDGPTRAKNEAVRRVQRRLDSELSPADIKACLHALPGPPIGAQVRVRARLAAASTAPAARSRRPWVAVGGVVLGVALLGTTAMAGAAAVRFALAPPEPQALDQSLDQQVVRSRGVTLVPVGDGHVAGTSDIAQIDWRSGDISVTTEHTAHVQTREATITVVSAGAIVSRSALGTHTYVIEGIVEVSCLASQDRRLTRAQTAMCPPVSVDGMLGRVRALSTSGTTANELLHEIQAGLARSEGTAAARTELGLLHAFTLASANRPEAALRAARSWLDEGHTLRRQKVQRLAAGLALQIEGCDGAVPHLEALSVDDPEALAALQTCTGDSP